MRGVIDMGKHEKRIYLEAIRKRYRRARRADKGKILDEFCSVCGYQRKYAIRLLSRKPVKLLRKRLLRPSRSHHSRRRLSRIPSRKAAVASAEIYSALP
jgi:hypothetical protein